MVDFKSDLDHHDNVHSPSHYKHGKKETIEVIQDCMTDDEYHGYLRGNVLSMFLGINLKVNLYKI